MLPTANLLTFIGITVVFIVIPGPSVLFVISRGVVLGRRAALATVLGNTAGVYLQVMAVAFGLGPLLERSTLLFTAIKLAGAAYLVYLGVQAVRHRRKLAEVVDQAVVPKSVGRILREDFVVGISNPKAAVFFAAVLPQFVEPDRGSTSIQMLMLGLICAVVALVSDSCWALLSGTVRSWLSAQPKRLEVLGGAGGLMMMVLGVRLAFVGQKD